MLSRLKKPEVRFLARFGDSNKTANSIRKIKKQPITLISKLLSKACLNACQLVRSTNVLHERDKSSPEIIISTFEVRRIIPVFGRDGFSLDFGIDPQYTSVDYPPGIENSTEY